jgi:hypothetical protein
VDIASVAGTSGFQVEDIGKAHSAGQAHLMQNANQICSLRQTHRSLEQILGHLSAQNRQYLGQGEANPGENRG